jgi:hypothetical protein
MVVICCACYTLLMASLGLIVWWEAKRRPNA